MWVLLGLDWVLPMMLLNFHVTCSYTFHFLFLWFEIVFLFCLLSLSLSLSLSLLNRTSLWHPNRENPFRLGTLFKVPGHPLRLFLLFHLTFGSVMRRLRRTSLRTSRTVVYIPNARSFYWISLTLHYLMSFRLGDGNLYVRNPCVVLCASVCYAIPRYTYSSYPGSCCWGTTSP